MDGFDSHSIQSAVQHKGWFQGRNISLHSGTTSFNVHFHTKQFITGIKFNFNSLKLDSDETDYYQITFMDHFPLKCNICLRKLQKQWKVLKPVKNPLNVYGTRMILVSGKMFGISHSKIFKLLKSCFLFNKKLKSYLPTISLPKQCK